MSFERAKYEFPIHGIAHHEKADAPAGIYILDGCWHMAAHESVAERQLLEKGALLVATLSFALASRPMHVRALPAHVFVFQAQFTAS